MTDPSDALKILQDAMLSGPVELERGQLDPSVYVHLHPGQRIPQYTFVTLDGKAVRAFATFALDGTYRGLPKLAVGYAVPDAFRNKGLAKAILRASIVELKNGFRGMPPFYVEAVVSEQNFASLRVAEAVLGKELQRSKDRHSGEPAVRFARKFESNP